VSQVRVLALAVLVVLVLAAVPTANAQGTWSTVVSPTGSDLHSIYMVSADEGWAVGDGGTIVHYAGGIWSLYMSGGGIVNLNSVFMVNAGEGWAVGDAGTIFHYSVSSWSYYSLPCCVFDNLQSVFMVSATDGWAVGGGTILHYYGAFGGWSFVTSPSTPGVLLLILSSW
jgi:photosystem II stability/assembly factor-like uncharacterized protein